MDMIDQLPVAICRTYILYEEIDTSIVLYGMAMLVNEGIKGVTSKQRSGCTSEVNKFLISHQCHCIPIASRSKLMNGRRLI